MHKMRHFNFENMKSVPISKESLAQYDAASSLPIISSYELPRHRGRLKLVVDTRNATRASPATANALLLADLKTSPCKRACNLLFAILQQISLMGGLKIVRQKYRAHLSTAPDNSSTHSLPSPYPRFRCIVFFF